MQPAALLAAVAALAAVGCGPGPPRGEPRAVVIGIDGADWKLIDALAAEGRMPHLSALCRRGTRASLETLVDIPLSPAIWTSVATGRTPTEHGVGWFLVDRPDGTRAPVRSTNRRTRAIWNILADHGMRATVIGWWATYPAEKIGEGAIVSDALGFHGFGRTARDESTRGKTYPPELFERAIALMPTPQQVSAGFARRFLHIEPDDYQRERFDPGRRPRPDPGNPVQLFQEYAVTAQGYTAIARDLLEHRPYDLLMVYFEQVDSLSHLFMKYAPPRLARIDEKSFARYRDVVSEWYAYQDELLGRLLERIDADTTDVLVLSDHGFKSGARRVPGPRTVDLGRAHLEHERLGILVAAGPGIRRDARIAHASVLDVTPTLLHLLGLPVARDMAGRVLEEILEPGFRAAHPIRYVASHEPKGALPAQKEPEKEEAPANSDLLRGLVALGYLDDNPPREAHAASSPEIHTNLGWSHLRAGQPEQALAEFQKARDLDPESSEALLGMGTLHLLQGRTALAQQLTREALRANPDSAAALGQLAQIARDRGDLEESIRLSRQALAINDASPALHLALGDSLQRAGRLADAAEAFRHALELDPDSFEAHYDLGVTLMNAGKPDAATEEYQAALRLDPDHPAAASALNNLGSILLQRGQPDQALARFEAATRASPGHFESRFNLAVQYLEQDRPEDAARMLEEAVALRPVHEAAHTLLGKVYVRLGRGQEAYRSLELVRRLHPGNWEARLWLADLHSSSGRPGPARALALEAIALGGDQAREELVRHPGLQALLGQAAGGPEGSGAAAAPPADRQPAHRP